MVSNASCGHQQLEEAPPRPLKRQKRDARAHVERVALGALQVAVGERQGPGEDGLRARERQRLQRQPIVRREAAQGLRKAERLGALRAAEDGGDARGRRVGPHQLQRPRHEHRTRKARLADVVGRKVGVGLLVGRAAHGGQEPRHFRKALLRAEQRRVHEPDEVVRRSFGRRRQHVAHERLGEKAEREHAGRLVGESTLLDHRRPTRAAARLAPGDDAQRAFERPRAGEQRLRPLARRSRARKHARQSKQVHVPGRGVPVAHVGVGVAVAVPTVLVALRKVRPRADFVVVFVDEANDRRRARAQVDAVAHRRVRRRPPCGGQRSHDGALRRVLGRGAPSATAPV